MDTEDIKRMNSMPDVMSRYGVRINPRGYCCCPFHNEKTASMKVWSNRYHCFGCGEHGDIFSFVMKMDGCDFPTAYQTLGGVYEHDEKGRQKARENIRSRDMERRFEEALKAKAHKEELEVMGRLRAANTVIRAVEPRMQSWKDSDDWVGAREYADALLTQQICESKLDDIQRRLK